MSAEALRVLVVAPFAPRLDGLHGGSRAVAQLVTHLSARHVVGLLVLREAGEPPVDTALRAACDFVEEVEIPEVGESVRSRLANRVRLRSALLRGTPTWAAERTAPLFASRLEQIASSWQPDVVQLEFRIMGQFLPALDGTSAVRVLVDHDAVSVEGHQPSRLFAPLEAYAWKALARTVSDHADAIVVFTRRDQELVERLNRSTPVERIPLGYDLPPRALDPRGTSEHGILFVGSFIHPPNVDAAERLAREILPLVRERVPDATATLVGSYPSARVEALGGNGVDVQGDVPDVKPFLEAAAVVAAPVRLGGGMRVKVLETLAAGKALVATSLAVDGLDVVDGRDVVLAESDDAFADALVALLLDAERRVALARAAGRWAARNLDIDSRVRAYEALYASLRAQRSGRDAPLSLPG